MKILIFLLYILTSNVYAETAHWYVVPMETVKNFENIPKRRLEETWEMTKIPEYHFWVAQNLEKARNLGWRPGHHRPDGTCYACHALKLKTYEKLRLQ